MLQEAKVRFLAACLFFLLTLSYPVWAKSSVQVVPLHYTSPESLIESIAPFIPDGVIIQGHGNKLILKGDDKKLEDILLLVKELDQALEQYEMTIHYGRMGRHQSSMTIISTQRSESKKKQYVIRVQEGSETLVRQDKLAPMVMSASGERLKTISQKSKSTYQDVSTEKLGSIVSELTKSESELAKLEKEKKELLLAFQNASGQAAIATAEQALETKENELVTKQTEIRQLQAEYAELRNPVAKSGEQQSHQADYQSGSFQKSYQKLPSGIYLKIQSQGQSVKLLIKRIDSTLKSKGDIHIEQVETELSIPLDSWVQISGNQEADSQQNVIATQRSDDIKGEIWVKVKKISF